MLSTFPAVFPSDPLLGNPFPTFNGGFTPWEEPDLFSAVESPEPVHCHSGSDVFHSPEPVISSSGSDETNSSESPKKLKRCSEEPGGEVPIVDERKRRRMISNRESARRSRMRKQKHLENLRNQVNRLRIENRELSNQLRFWLFHCHRVRAENDRLAEEQSMLRQKLSNICEILVLRQLPEPSSPAWPFHTNL